MNSEQEWLRAGLRIQRDPISSPSLATARLGDLGASLALSLLLCEMGCYPQSWPYGAVMGSHEVWSGEHRTWVMLPCQAVFPAASGAGKEVGSRLRGSPPTFGS